MDVDIVDLNLDQAWYRIIGDVTTANYTWTGIIEQSVWDQIGNGTALIEIFANDTMGNFRFDDVFVRKDINAPILTIIEPNPYDLFGYNSPNCSIYMSGLDLSYFWYVLDGNPEQRIFPDPKENLDLAIDQALWETFVNGTVTIRFFANDSTGNLAENAITVRKDIFNPIIIINSAPHEGYWNEPPSLNISVYEPNFNTMWYLVGTQTFSLINSTEQKIDSILWNGLDQGEFIIYIFANDSVGNLNDTIAFTLYKDTLSPEIYLNMCF